jgi:hypothetical protein
MEIKCLPTYNINGTRSYMMPGDNKKDYIPEYHEKIYEFSEYDFFTKMKDFILNNPNMQCLVSIYKMSSEEL